LLQEPHGVTPPKDGILQTKLFVFIVEEYALVRIYVYNYAVDKASLDYLGTKQ
jgi:hypothetical protein